MISPLFEERMNRIHIGVNVIGQIGSSDQTHLADLADVLMESDLQICFAMKNTSLCKFTRSGFYNTTEILNTKALWEILEVSTAWKENTQVISFHYSLTW